MIIYRDTQSPFCLRYYSNMEKSYKVCFFPIFVISSILAIKVVLAVLIKQLKQENNIKIYSMAKLENKTLERQGFKQNENGAQKNIQN